MLGHVANDTPFCTSVWQKIFSSGQSELTQILSIWLKRIVGQSTDLKHTIPTEYNFSLVDYRLRIIGYYKHWLCKIMLIADYPQYTVWPPPVYILHPPTFIPVGHRVSTGQGQGYNLIKWKHWTNISNFS